MNKNKLNADFWTTGSYSDSFTDAYAQVFNDNCNKYKYK